MIYSSIPGLTEMSILMVGEILAMFPSSKASGAGMGFLNQSTTLGMKSLVSTAYWSWDCCGRKYARWCISSQGKSGLVMDSIMSSSDWKMGRLEEGRSPDDVVMCDWSSCGEGLRCTTSTDPRSTEGESRVAVGRRLGELSLKDDDRYKMVVEGSAGSIVGGGM